MESKPQSPAHLFQSKSIQDDDERTLRVLILLCCALLSTYPLLTVSMARGHDLAFHLTRVSSIASGLSAGIFPVRLYSNMAYSFGYPSGICYPDSFLYIPALLVLSGFSVHKAYVLFVFAINLVTSLLSYYCFSRTVESKRGGLVASILWTLAPYRLTCVLPRAALGEALALMFAPLIIYGLTCIFLDTKTVPNYGWLLTSLGIAGVINSHVISAAIYFVLGAIMLVPLVRLRRRTGVLADILKTAALSTLLSLGYLIPFLDYYTHHELYVQTASQMPDVHALELSQLFSTFQPAIGSSRPLGESLSGEMPLYAGWGILGTFIPVLLVCRDHSFRANGEEYQSRWMVRLAVVAAVLLVMTTWVFPWSARHTDSPLGTIVDAMSIIQFPWRLLGPATLLLALNAGISWFVGDKRVHVLTCALLLLSIIECGATTGSFLHDASYVDLGFVTSDTNMGGVREYLPSPLQRSFVEEWETIAPSAQTQGTSIDAWRHDSPQLFSMAATCTSQDGAHIRLPLFWHREYVLSISKSSSDEALSGHLENDEGFAALVLDAPGHYDCRIEFIEPVSWRLSEAATITTAVVLC